MAATAIANLGTYGAYMERTHKAILCLCHDPNMLEIRKLLLERFGYTVWPADSVEGAKAIAGRVCPDMLLMDNSYPPDDLESLAEQVKSVCPEMVAVLLLPSFSIHNHERSAIDRYVPREEQPSVLMAHIYDLLHEKDGASESSARVS